CLSMTTALRLLKTLAVRSFFSWIMWKFQNTGARLLQIFLLRNILERLVFLSLMALWEGRPVLSKWHIVWHIAGANGASAIIILRVKKMRKSFTMSWYIPY